LRLSGSSILSSFRRLARRRALALAPLAALAASAAYLWASGYSYPISLPALIALLALVFAIGVLHGLDRVLPVFSLLVAGAVVLATLVAELLTGSTGAELGIHFSGWRRAAEALVATLGSYFSGYALALALPRLRWEPIEGAREERGGEVPKKRGGVRWRREPLI